MSEVKLKGVRKVFRLGDEEIEVFRDVSLEVKKGEAVAVMGPSGVGKTTLLHIIGTLERPTEGKVFLMGRDVTSLSDEQLSRLRNREIGFVFQFHHLLPEFTALENVMMPLIIRGQKDAKKKAEELLKRVGLGHRLSHRPAQLSGGERQRVAIARAIVGQPRLLLADEPTGNLDWKTAESIINLLMDLHREKKFTTIIVTHNSYIASKCDKIYLLEKGRLICYTG